MNAENDFKPSHEELVDNVPNPDNQAKITENSTYVKVSSENIPFEMMDEILSWLPVKSLLRFKCVCKQWCFLIEQNYKFKAKHFARARPLKLPYQFRWQTGNRLAMACDKDFNLVLPSSGLFLEKQVSNSKVCRIRNPAMQQVVNLPDADEEPIPASMMFVFNSITGACKVSYFHRKEVAGFGSEVGLQVISVGDDDRWRTMKLPTQNGTLLLAQQGKHVLRRKFYPPCRFEGVAHAVEVIEDEQNQKLYLQVQSFNVWSESFTTSTLPEGVFLDLKKAHILCWNCTIAVAEFEDEVLNILVLEDWKQPRWSESKIIVPMKISKDFPVLKDEINLFRAGSDEMEPQNEVESIRFFEQRKDESKASFSWYAYDIKSGKITRKKITYEPTKEKYFWDSTGKTSLMTVKGMRPEIGLENKAESGKENKPEIGEVNKPWPAK